MKLTITNVFFVVIASLIRKIIWSLLWLCIAFVLLVIFIPRDPTPSQATLGGLLVLLAPIIHMLIVSIDSYIYAKSASIEINENTVNLHANNLFNRTNNSLPIAQINQINVIQTLIFKIFGVSAVIVSDESGTTNMLWGFNYTDASKFLEEFNSKYKIKFAK